MELKQVTCGGCGYLSAVQYNGELTEATRHFRTNCHFPDGYLHTLQCLKDLRPYKPIPGAPYVEQVQGFLNHLHICEGYTEYRCGFSPKEHMQMTLDQELRAKHAAEAEKLRLWQEEQRTKDKIWQEEQRIKDKARSRRDMILAAIFGLCLEPIRLTFKAVADRLAQPPAVSPSISPPSPTTK